jgi:hypothetical protein
VSGANCLEYGWWMGGCDNPVLEKGFSYQSENISEIGIPHKASHMYTISLPPHQYCTWENSWSFLLYLRFKIREGRTQTIGECFRREYRVLCHIVQGDFSKDFYEVNISIFKTSHFHSRSLYFVIFKGQGLYT